MRSPQPLAISPDAPRDVPVPTRRETHPRLRGPFRESFLFAAPVNCVLVGRSTAAEASDLVAFSGALAGIGALILAAGLAGGWWLINRALLPVEKISDTAEGIATGDLSRRIGIEESESELGRLAAVLNSTFARLEMLFAQQVRFTADAAHELRTPVTVMLTQTQSALARERSPAEYRETLEACQRAAQRMRRLIESLLELARLDAGQEPLGRTQCDLSTIAAECLNQVRPLADARGLRVQADLENVHLQGNAEHLSQVVTNLLTNAIDYNRDDGEIRVVVQGQNGTAVLVVSNTGPGIAATDLPHVFERFHRGDTARTGSVHSGLGLAITRTILQAHGGTIEVASQPGEGATFTVKLPAS
jgi:heavy metal sensor kinase